MADYPKQGEIWWTLFYEGWERPSIVVSRNDLNRSFRYSSLEITLSKITSLIQILPLKSYRSQIPGPDLLYMDRLDGPQLSSGDLL